MKYLRVALVMVIGGLLGSFGLVADPVNAQSSGFSNPAITELVEMGLVTPVNHEAVVNGIETTIDWVYADASQIIVCLTMHDLDYSAVGSNQIPAKETIRVVGPDGDEFQRSTASATTSDAPESRVNLTVVTHFYPQSAMLPPLAPGESRENYFVSLGSDLPATLDLQLKLDIDVNASPETWQLPRPGDPAELTLPVTATLHHGVTLTPETTLTMNGQDVTLQRLTIAPSQTLAEVCYTSPDAENWQAVTRLHLDDQTILPRAFSNRLTQAPAADDDRRCVEILFDVIHRSSSPTVDFTVEFLFPAPLDPNAYWEQVREGLRQEGIELQLYPLSGVDYDVISAPDGMSDEDIYQRIRQQRLTLTPVVDGPWMFTLELTPEG